MTGWGVEGVTVRFGSRLALDAVSLEVAPGQISSIVGGDGAGKTTLCRVVVGLTGPTLGAVRVPPRIGYQSDTSGVWGDLTAVAVPATSDLSDAVMVAALGREEG
jgi:ABC-type multidrug transport system ATPase subunit